MHSLEMRAKTVENKIAEFLRKLKNRLSEPEFWRGGGRGYKKLFFDFFSLEPLFYGPKKLFKPLV